MNAIFFDLDDTLVDTSKSFDTVVLALVEKYGNRPSSRVELHELRAGGGFNDDWDSVVELLRRQGRLVRREEIAQEGLELYLEVAEGSEELMVELAFLQKLGGEVPLFVVTGRVKAEYEPVWGSRLDPVFQEVVCRDTHPNLPPKPSPAQIVDLMQRWKVTGGLFVGNSVDDMRAGKGAGLKSIGVSTNQPVEVLMQAGADLVLRSPREYHRLSDLI